MTVYRYTDPTTGVEVVDCDYCIAGRVPATHHVLGAGFVRCPYLDPQPACCDLATFYPLDLTDPADPAAAIDAWAKRLNTEHRLIPVLCCNCGGVTDLQPMPAVPDGLW